MPERTGQALITWNTGWWQHKQRQMENCPSNNTVDHLEKLLFRVYRGEDPVSIVDILESL
ncbi:hypothetical protein H5410_024328 [Solanum commersonii]|uniref:Uncharacterized protein n=1 Tax=Solanum commersonii TaxID=4109 RepID=A0A9J5ZLP2_SOLCO|nr:hypothetical protein H5410_024328 [Solanum commersonii]